MREHCSHDSSAWWLPYDPVKLNQRGQDYSTYCTEVQAVHLHCKVSLVGIPSVNFGDICSHSSYVCNTQYSIFRSSSL